MCDQSHSPACFPEPPAPGRAQKAMSLGYGAGSHWKPSGDWAEPGSSECSLACLRLSGLGEVPGGGPQPRCPLWRLAFPAWRLEGADGASRACSVLDS